jgi:hypothetical protein
VVIEGAAGTVSVEVPVLVVSATEVAVMVIVCAEVVAVGAVKVAEVVVSLESVPALTLQVTPALFLSLATVAMSVIAFVPSTEDAEAFIVTTGEELPPHPARNDAIAKMTARKDNRL